MILVTGSLAYDYIMSYEDAFSNSILPENLKNLSVSFLVNKLRKHRGGTAGNIAYNLKLLKGAPILVSTAGYDFSGYAEEFKTIGINLKYVNISEDEPTASAFITSDSKGSQITMFYPGAMGKSAKKDLSPIASEIKLAIIAPEYPETMLHYARECRKHSIPYIFDPGQNTPTFSKEEFITAISGSKGLIVNDYEWALFQEKTGLSPEEVLRKTEILIITLGEKGSLIRNKNNRIEVPAALPHEIHDPTGCGDAYRAGFLKGLLMECNLKECGKMAALAATYCIEEFGTQNHQYTRTEFEERLKEF